MGRIISLKYDFTFKHLFLNREVRRHFISDAFGLPLEEIREVCLANTFLWKRYRRQKQGIVDVMVELNNDSRVNIELQIEMLEIHVIELNKPLNGTSRMDDWIRLFNVRTEEELEMLEASTKNVGIIEAIKEVRIMSLGKTLRALHEAKLKEIRDKNAREDYVRSEGIRQGLELGLEQGTHEGEDRVNRLYRALITDQRYDDMEKAINDKTFREQLYREYGM